MNVKGGVGKTTLAVNISHVLSQHFGHRVLTLDIDPQFNATQYVFKRNEWGDIVYERIHTALLIYLDAKLQGFQIKENIDLRAVRYRDIEPRRLYRNWHFLPGTINLYTLYESYENYTSVLNLKLKEYLQYIRGNRQYEFVIIDTPPTPSAWMRSAIIASDYYLVPVRPDPVSVFGIPLLNRIIRQMKEKEPESKIEGLGIVFNMYDKRIKAHDEQMEKLENALKQMTSSQLTIFENKLKQRASILSIDHEDIFEERLILNRKDKSAREEIIAITQEIKDRIQ